LYHRAIEERPAGPGMYACIEKAQPGDMQIGDNHETAYNLKASFPDTMLRR